MRKIFGTDGIRGKANIYPITSEVALALGRAVAYQARQRSSRPKIIVGKDTRLSCYMVEMALVSGICSMGADVLMTGPIPTPGIAYLTVDMRCDAGIMITASHNPFEDNGIKVFGPDGFKLSDAQEEELEKYILSHHTTEQFISTNDNSYPDSERVGKAFKIEDARGRYIAHLKSVFPKNMDLSGMKIAIDCANGASYKVAPAVLEELGAETVVLGNEPNGTNINEMCGALYTNYISLVVLDQKCDIGIALDGDADRVKVVDQYGHVINGDAIIAHLAKEYTADPCVVGTTMSNMGLEEFLESIGGSLVRTDVGDRYVIEKMREGGLMIGGEESGHIIMFEHSTTGDGMVAALKLLQYLRYSGMKASDLSEEAPMCEQVMINIPVDKKIPIEDLPELDKAMDDAYYDMDCEGRVLVRYSGTENKLRIMIEHKEWKVADDMANKLAEIAKECLKD